MPKRSYFWENVKMTWFVKVITAKNGLHLENFTSAYRLLFFFLLFWQHGDYHDGDNLTHETSFFIGDLCLILMRVD